MPLLVRCRQCRKIIYQSQDIHALDEIISKFDGRCPKCGRQLERTLSDVKISAIERKAGKAGVKSVVR